jgi:hypothetical protein
MLLNGLRLITILKNCGCQSPWWAVALRVTEFLHGYLKDKAKLEAPFSCLFILEGAVGNKNLNTLVFFYVYVMYMRKYCDGEQFI